VLRAFFVIYRDAFRGHPPAVWRLAVATLINRSGTMVQPFLILFLTDERGLTPADAGLLMALWGLGGLCGAYLGGWLCDRLTSQRVMVGSLALTGVGFLVLGHLEGRAPLAVALFLVSLAGDAYRPALVAGLAAATPPEGRPRTFALNRLAINLGMSLGPAVGGFLALLDYFWLFVVDGATCLAATALLATGPRLPAPPAVPAAGAAPTRSPWRDGSFLLFILLMTVLGTVFCQSTSTLPLTLHDDYRFTEAEIGLMYLVNTGVIVLFEMVLVHAVRRVEPMLLVAVGSFFFCLGFGILPFGSGVVWVIFTVVVWTVGEMLSMSAAVTSVANRAGTGSLGRAMGLYVLSFSAAQVLAPIVGTWVYQHWGATPLWLACGALALPLTLGFLALGRVWRVRGGGLPSHATSSIVEHH
jgi:predicted MFS family arabinose efflux permease